MRHDSRKNLPRGERCEGWGEKRITRREGARATRSRVTSRRIASRDHANVRGIARARSRRIFGRRARAHVTSVHRISHSHSRATSQEIMVRASTLGLHATLTTIIAGLEFLEAAHPKSAVFAFAPTVFTGEFGLSTAAASAAGAFAVSLVGSFLCVIGIAAALKIRDRTLRIGEKIFFLAHLAIAANAFAFRDRVKGVFPGVFALHAASAALFHLGDTVKIPITVPSILGKAKMSSRTSSKPAKKTSSKKAPKKTPSRASSRKSK